MIGNAPDFKQPKPNFTAFHNHYGKEFKSEVHHCPLISGKNHNVKDKVIRLNKKKYHIISVAKKRPCFHDLDKFVAKTDAPRKSSYLLTLAKSRSVLN